MIKKQGFVICIPARYSSTRFPGKVLAELGGKPIIRWVYEKAILSTAEKVIIATDDSRVKNTVEEFGGDCVLTSPNHPSGTDRVWEAIKNLNCRVVINIQGDEPLIEVSTIDKLIELFEDNNEVQMGTVLARADREKIGKNPNVVKAVVAKDGAALYFSRSEIPFIRDAGESFPIFKHLGIYGYKKETLCKIISLPQSELERCENLEQLRALDNGIKIHTVILEKDFGIGIDTKEDLKNAEILINNQKY